MAVHTVFRNGQWFNRLSRVIAEAQVGDIVQVPDTEMLGFAVFGIQARGFTTTDQRLGIVVHLADGETSTQAGYEKGSWGGRPGSPQNIPKNPLAGLPTTEMLHVLGVGVIPGLPNANGDSYTPEAVRKANEDYWKSFGGSRPKTLVSVKPTEAQVREHQAKHGVLPDYSPRDAAHTMSMYNRWTAFTRRTLTREYTRDFAYGFRATIYPNRTVTLVQIADPTKPFEVVGMPFDQVQELVEFLNCPMATPGPLGFSEFYKQVTDILTKNEPGKVFAVDSLGQNPCTMFRDRGKSTLTYDTLRQLGNWRHQRERVPGETDKGLVERELTFEQATQVLMGNEPDTPVDQLVRRMWQAAVRGLPLMMVVAKPVEHSQYLIPPRHRGCFEVPLDEEKKTVEYADSTKFICQQCGRTYLYGDAKQRIAAAESTCTPIAFCSGTCGREYARRTGFKIPPVGAEIPLGEPEMCNLGTTASEAKILDQRDGRPIGECYTETHDAADPIGLDKLAASLGFEAVGPTHVVEQKVTVDLDAQRKSWAFGELKLKYPEKSDKELRKLVEDAANKQT